MDANRLLEIQDASKSFGSTKVLDEVSFSVAQGEIIALLGPSGCGKTTTLRAIAGFEPLDYGRVVIAGQDMTLRRPYERPIGLVFQDYALFPHMTVGQNVGFGMRHRGIPRREIPERTASVLARVQLDGLAHRKPSELSGGQQQRVALARAMATEPEVMLLDEPLSNLDASLRLQLRIELRQVLTAAGSTAIIVTHDQEEAMGLADRIVLMKAGRIVQIDAPADLYARPRSRFAAEFIGEATWFEGILRPKSSGMALETGAGLIPIEGRSDLSPGAAFGFCIRPERISVLLAEDAPLFEGADTRLAGEVTYVERLGGDVRIWVRMVDGASAQVSAKNTSVILPEPGAKVWLAFRAADGVLLPPVDTKERVR
jgi:putative spermidine/putrescine transport system ATP-binding protein/putrescine transport system ATP-binding protein